jgi:hypothetical protein
LERYLTPQSHADKCSFAARTLELAMSPQERCERARRAGADEDCRRIGFFKGSQESVAVSPTLRWAVDHYKHFVRDLGVKAQSLQHGESPIRLGGTFVVLGRKHVRMCPGQRKEAQDSVCILAFRLVDELIARAAMRRVTYVHKLIAAPGERTTASTPDHLAIKRQI